MTGSPADELGRAPSNRVREARFGGIPAEGGIFVETRWPTTIGLIVGMAAGALVWAASPAILGRAEPWDADGPGYAILLLVAGLATGLAAPRSHWAAHYLGGVLGQLGYEFAVLGVGPLVLLGAAFMLVYSLIFLLGAVLGAFLVRRWRRLDDPR